MWICEQVSTPEAAIYLPRRLPLHRSQQLLRVYGVETTTITLHTQTTAVLADLQLVCIPRYTICSPESQVRIAPVPSNSKLTNLLYSLPGTPRCLHQLYQRLLPLLPPYNHHLRKPGSSIPYSLFFVLVRILLPLPLQPLLRPQTPNPHLPSAPP